MVEKKSKKKRRKKAKSKTENKVWGGIISCMRTNFARYSPKHKEVIDRCRIEKPRYNKDGSLSKKPEVWHKCENCLSLFKELDVDHMDGLIPLLVPSKFLSLQYIYQRLNCDTDRLQGLCKKCHSEKTDTEREKRKAYLKMTKYVISETVDISTGKVYTKLGECIEFDDYCENLNKSIKKDVEKNSNSLFNSYIIYASLCKKDAEEKFNEIKR